MDTINLYTMKGCPKCHILRNICAQSEYIKNNDFKECLVNTEDKSDTDYQLLLEKSISSMPVLLVNNTFYTFNEAVAFIREKDGE